MLERIVVLHEFHQQVFKAHIRPANRSADQKGNRAVRVHCREESSDLVQPSNRIGARTQCTSRPADSTAAVRRTVLETFKSFTSGSIQQVIYQMGTRMLESVPEIAEVHLEAQNRTWDQVAEQDQTLGVYTDPRPPYGCLGLRMKR